MLDLPLEGVLMRCDRMRTVNVSGTMAAQGEGVVRILMNCPRLRRLNASRPPARPATDGPLASVQQLVAADGTGGTDGTGGSTASTAIACTRTLETLSLSRNTSLPARFFERDILGALDALTPPSLTSRAPLSTPWLSPSTGGRQRCASWSCRRAPA
jgi:hypothetical protein